MNTLDKALAVSILVAGLGFGITPSTDWQAAPVEVSPVQPVNTEAYKDSRATEPTTDQYTNSIGMVFARIPNGTFFMGTDGYHPLGIEAPRHRVKISKPFYLGIHEVTQQQWKEVIGTRPPDSRENATVIPTYFEGSNHPETWISWDDANKFLRRLSEREDCQCYRLPTEAEWEYAARAGNDRQDVPNLEDVAWFLENSGDKPFLARRPLSRQAKYWEAVRANNPRTHPVGEKSPNEWGLYDMYGNVSELVLDDYGPYAEIDVLSVDPRGSFDGFKAQRGCSFSQPRHYCGPSFRGGSARNPSAGGPNLGFRVLRIIK